MIAHLTFHKEQDSALQTFDPSTVGVELRRACRRMSPGLRTDYRLHLVVINACSQLLVLHTQAMTASLSKSKNPRNPFE